MRVETNFTPNDKSIIAMVGSLDSVFILYDKAYTPIYWNDVARQALPTFFETLENGLTLDRARRNTIKSLLPELPADNIEKTLNEIIELQVSGRTYEFLGENGRLYIFKNYSLGSDRALGVGIDITEVSEYRDRNASMALEVIKLANTDQLTALSNRRHFLNTMEEKFGLAAKNNEELHLGFIDLNGFKGINDLYGHKTGDDILQTVGFRLKQTRDELSIAARLGGDEFAVLCWNQAKNTELIQYGQEFLEAINRPYVIEGRSINISGSIGWARFPKDAQTIKDLLKKSDFALYESKRSTPSQPVLFSKEHELMFHRERTIIAELEKDNIADELHLHFQPIHDIKSNSIRGFEALARWTSPKLGPVSPDEFIAFAEKSKRITELTPILFQKALEIAESWPKSYILHFNLSALDICSKPVILKIVDLLQSSNLDPANLALEVTETEVIDNFSQLNEIQKILADAGIKLYLDDFGSGYSNLNYITQINAAGLKIDKDFFSQDSVTPESLAIMESINFLCQKLELDFIVEGVEHYSQLQQLSAMGISFIQGYYFSKPLPPEDLPTYILSQFRNRFNRQPPKTVIEKKLRA